MVTTAVGEDTLVNMQAKIGRLPVVSGYHSIMYWKEADRLPDEIESSVPPREKSVESNSNADNAEHLDINPEHKNDVLSSNVEENSVNDDNAVNVDVEMKAANEVQKQAPEIVSVSSANNNDEASSNVAEVAVPQVQNVASADDTNVQQQRSNIVTVPDSSRSADSNAIDVDVNGLSQSLSALQTMENKQSKDNEHSSKGKKHSGVWDFGYAHPCRWDSRMGIWDLSTEYITIEDSKVTSLENYSSMSVRFPKLHWNLSWSTTGKHFRDLKFIEAESIMLANGYFGPAQSGKPVYLRTASMQEREKYMFKGSRSKLNAVGMNEWGVQQIGSNCGAIKMANVFFSMKQESRMFALTL